MGRANGVPPQAQPAPQRQARLLRPSGSSPGLRAAPAGTIDQALTQAAGDAVLAMVAVLHALTSWPCSNCGCRYLVDVMRPGGIR